MKYSCSAMVHVLDMIAIYVNLNHEMEIYSILHFGMRKGLSKFYGNLPTHFLSLGLLGRKRKILHIANVPIFCNFFDFKRRLNKDWHLTSLWISQIRDLFQNWICTEIQFFGLPFLLINDGQIVCLQVSTFYKSWLCFKWDVCRKVT